MDRLLTVKEIAARAGVTANAVYLALRRGQISGRKIGKSWYFSPAVVSLLGSKRISGSLSPPEEEGISGESYQFRLLKARTEKEEAQALKERYHAEIARLEYETRAGLLLPKAEVEKRQAAAAIAIRSAFLALPQAVAPDLAPLADPAVISDYLDGKIREILTELAALATDGSPALHPKGQCRDRESSDGAERSR